MLIEELQAQTSEMLLNPPLAPKFLCSLLQDGDVPDVITKLSEARSWDDLSASDAMDLSLLLQIPIARMLGDGYRSDRYGSREYIDLVDALERIIVSTVES